MRLSPIPEKAPRGNAEKYYSYREAWTRIAAACQQGFFFEAVAIQESIIADRLVSYLTGVGSPLVAAGTKKQPRFADLIREWGKQHSEPIAVGGFVDLRGEVDRWREARNRVVHSIVKSHPGAATAPIDEFLADAGDTAQRGVLLAKAVSNWCDKTLRHLRKQRTA